MSTLRFSLIFGLVLGLLTLGSANELYDFLNDEALPEGLEVDINKVIDANIKYVQDALQKFDPAELPDVPVSGTTQLYNGWLSVLSRVNRTGDSSLEYDNKILSLDLRVGWDILKCDFDYAFKLWFIQKFGKMQGSVGDISVNLKISVDFSNWSIIFEQFKFEHVGSLNIELDGIVGGIMKSFIGRIILGLAKNRIMYNLEDITSRMIKETIDNLNNQVPNKNRQFMYIDLVKMNRDLYVMDDYVKENY